MEAALISIAVVGPLILLALLGLAIRIVKQWERGVVFRFGRQRAFREPGFRLIVPLVDRMIKVDKRIVTYVLEPQEVITRDNVTIRVNAVV